MSLKAEEERKKIDDEGVNFLTPPYTKEDISKKVESGLEFILSHFSQPHFPRKVSTAATRNVQKPVNDKDRAMLYYQGALWEDCRIAAFRIGQENPDLIFIDLDAKDFSSMRSFKLALTKTLKNIKEKLGGAHPSLIWSGRGYHIIQPIHCPIALETIKELAALEPYTSNKFLQFAERYLSAGRCDNANHPALKSCMLRIPTTVNSKCKAAGGGIDPEVKVLQEWDGHRPSYKLLLGSFYADLMGQHQSQTSCKKYPNPLTNQLGRVNEIPWIEKLFQTPIEDYRKYAIDLIIIPYLIVIKDITCEDEIYYIAMKWLDRCSELRRLEPSRHYFTYRVRRRIDEVIHGDRVPPMRSNTLKQRNFALYERVFLRH